MAVEIKQLPPWGPKSVTGKTGRERQAALLAEAEHKRERKAAKAAKLDKVVFPKPQPKPEPSPEPESPKRTRESQTPAEREKANRAAAKRLRKWKRTHG